MSCSAACQLHKQLVEACHSLKAFIGDMDQKNKTISLEKSIENYFEDLFAQWFFKGRARNTEA